MTLSFKCEGSAIMVSKVTVILLSDTTDGDVSDQIFSESDYLTHTSVRWTRKEKICDSFASWCSLICMSLIYLIMKSERFSNWPTTIALHRKASGSTTCKPYGCSTLVPFYNTNIIKFLKQLLNILNRTSHFATPQNCATMIPSHARAKKLYDRVF